jgi:hypothetical protein
MDETAPVRSAVIDRGQSGSLQVQGSAIGCETDVHRVSVYRISVSWTVV